MSSQFDQSLQQEQMVGADYLSQFKIQQEEDPVEIFLQKMGQVCFKEIIGKNQQLSSFNDMHYQNQNLKEQQQVNNSQENAQGQKSMQTMSMSEIFNYMNKDHLKLVNCYKRFIRAYDLVSFVIHDEDEQE